MKYAINNEPIKFVKATIEYELSLGGISNTWTTDNFDNLVRMYCNLKMNRLRIKSINIITESEDD